MATASQATFLFLPVELRLHIATYAFEQPRDAGLTSPTAGWLDTEYDPSVYLSILLVCRQFHDDFAQLAFQKTRFIVKRDDFTGSIRNLRVEKLRALRKLAIRHRGLAIFEWHRYPFNNENLRLDELCIATDDRDCGRFTGLLRRLQHVKTIRILPGTAVAPAVYARLAGAMYKEDHYQRYDAPDAPDVGHVWFEPSFVEKDLSIGLVAKAPQPVVVEEEYMNAIKSKIEELVDIMAHQTI
jgi:hypothetical protein